MIRRLSSQFYEDLLQSGGGTYDPADQGTVNFTVRKDTDVPLTANDGEYAPLQTDSNGYLKVAIKDSSLGKEVASAAGAADTGVPMLVVRTDTLGAIAPADGDYTTLRVNAQGALHVTSTGGGGSGVQYIEDTAHIPGATGTLGLAIRNDTPGTLVSADGDYAPLQVDADGALRVAGNIVFPASATTALDAIQTATEAVATTVVGGEIQAKLMTSIPAGTNAIGTVEVTSLVPGTGVTDLGKAVGNTAGATDTGVAVLAVDNLGDYTPLTVDAAGSLQVGLGTTDSTNLSTIAGAVVLNKMQVELATGSNTIGTVNLSATDNAVLDNIQTAVDAINTNTTGTKNVSIVDPLPTGSNTIGTVNLSATDNAVLDNIQSSVDTVAGAVILNKMQVELAAGSNSIGTLGANSGVDIGDVDVISVVPGTSATNLGKAKGGAAGATDTGVAILAVDSSNNYTHLSIDGTGSLQVTGIVDLGIADSALLNDIKTNTTGTKNVSIVDPIPSGTNTIGTVNLSATDNAVLDNIQASVDTVAGAVILNKLQVELAAGSNTIGKVEITDIIPGVTATALGKAVDSAAGATDTGVASLAVRRDANTALTNTDGDYTPLYVDANGNLKISGTVDLGATDNTVLDAIQTSVDTVAAAVAGTEMQVDIVAPIPAGTNTIGNVGINSITPGTGATDLGKAVDSASGPTDTGVAVLAIRDDILTTLTPVDGDYTTLRVNAQGALHVTAAGSGFASVQYAEDTSHTTGDQGTMALVVRNDTPGTLVSTDGDYAPLQVDSAGSLRVSLPATTTTVLDAIQTATEAVATTVVGGEIQANLVSSIPAGTNAIGMVGVTSVVPGTGANDLGKAAGSAVGATDTGVAMLAVDTSNNYAPLNLDTTGSLVVTGVVDLGTTDNTLLTGIKTSVDTVAAAVTGTEMQVDIVAPLPSGSNTIGTVNLSATDNAVLDAIQASVDAINTNTTGTKNVSIVDPLPTGSNTIGTVNLSATDNAVLDNIQTAVDAINTNTTGTKNVSIVDPIPTGTNTIGTVNLSATDNAVLDAIQTSVELIDDAIEGVNMRVKINTSLPAGSNNIGSVNIVTGTAAADIAKAVDAAAGPTDTGVAVLAIRDDNLTTLTPADGDYTHLRVNAQGALHVTAVGGGFASVQYAEDSAHVSGDQGTMALVVRNDTPGTLVSANGDYAPLQVDSAGSLRVMLPSATTTVLDNIQTSVDTVAGAVAGNEMQVDIVAPLPSGSNSIGTLGPNSGVDIGDVDVTSVIPGTGATNLGKAITNTYGATDTGVSALAIRSDYPKSFTANNGYAPLQVNASGRLKTSPDLMKSAFGELLVANLTARAVLVFNYNVNTRYAITTNTGGAPVPSSVNNMLYLSTSTTTSSTASIRSKRVVNYRPGVGIVIRFTAIFTVGVAGTYQWIGVGTHTTDGFFFGYDGVNFCVMRVRGGVQDKILKANWNIDKADGTGLLPAIDFTKGNVFQIKFQWLGFGAIDFCIEDPVSGMFTPVHKIQYANANIVPSINNPSLPLYAAVSNGATTSDIILRSGCIAGYMEGDYDRIGPIFSIDSPPPASANIGSTNYTNLVTISNATTFHSSTNRIILHILEVSASFDGGRNGAFQIRLNATFASALTYTSIDANNSPVSRSTSNIDMIANSGTLLKTILISKVDDKDIELESYNIEVFPGDTLSIVAMVDGNTTQARAAVTWRESF